jgi:hypothetical protein
MKQPQVNQDEAFRAFYNSEDRRIYREALPGYDGRLDIARINPDEENFAYQWIEQLLRQGSLHREINLGFHENEQFQHLFFESRNGERLRAFSGLGFGFPLFVALDGEELVVAPLFIWPLKIAPFSNQSDSWLITHESEQPVMYNRFLAGFIKEKYDCDWEDRFAAMVASRKPDVESLSSFCLDLANELQLERHDPSLTLVACPSMEKIDELAREGSIQWSGVLGLFPVQVAPASAEGAQTLLQNRELAAPGHPFGLLDLDPCQASAMEAVARNRVVLVEGGPGSGKTHLLTHLLTNALSNGARALVVSPNVEELKEVQNYLNRLGLESLNFLLKDPVHDKFLLLEVLKAAANTEPEPANHREDHFRIALDKAGREKVKLDANYRAVRRPVFGNENWTETVGRFLMSNRREGKEMLSSQLNAQEFTFSFDEYRQLCEAIEKSYPLYLKIGALNHPLANLHAGIFVHQNKDEGLSFVNEQLETMHDKATRLHLRYIQKANAYSEKLTSHYENYYEQLAARLAHIEELLADYGARYGDDFRKGSGAQRLYGLFSDHYRKIAEARTEVIEAYRQLIRTFKRSNYFDHQFYSTRDGKHVAKVQENLKGFSRALETWREQLPDLVQEEIRRLNHKTVHPDLDFREQIQELEYALDLLVEEINGSGLYQLPLENKNLTIPKRQKFLEEVIEQLEKTRYNLRDYDPFYDWQRNWFSLPEPARRLIKALVKVKPEDWQAAFDSWHLFHCLTKAYDPALPTGENSIKNFVGQYLKLRPLLVPQTVQLWQDRRSHALKELRKGARETYNRIFSRRNNELSSGYSLKDVLAKGFESITAHFPVLLAPPHVAAEILPGKEESFDYLLIDGSHFLPWLQAAPLLHKAKRIVVFSDPELENPTDPYSLPAFLRQAAPATVALDIVHRRTAGNLQQLPIESPVSEAAQEGFTMHYEQIDGRYDERQAQNEAEAQHVIRMLNLIKETPQRTFPSVGIACFSRPQRDLILQYLLQIKRKRQPGAEKILQLERNGLGVFFLDEPAGQHFDILIISSTFGTVDTKGNLSDHMRSLNQSEGLRRLYLIMSRALREVFVLSSIPIEDLDEFKTDSRRPGFFLLANYFLYAKAVHESDKRTQDAIAERVRQWRSTGEHTYPHSIFTQEIALTLEPYLGAGRIRQNVREGRYFFPLLISSLREGQPTLQIQPDEYFAGTPATDYLWEYNRREDLAGHGYLLMPVWSARWWKNPKQEARRLAGAIIKLDE